MKRKICLVLVIALILVSALPSCGKKKDNGASKSVIEVVSSESDTQSEIPQEVSSQEQEEVSSAPVSTELTEAFKGDWQVVSVYQEAKISDRFKEDGLKEEKTGAIHIGEDFYTGYGCHFSNPSYKIEEVDASVLYDKYGFTTENAEKDFGKKVTMLTAEDGDGLEFGSGVYFLKGDTLIKFGLGSHLYVCQRVQAVG